jgi:hypothetical protein
VKVKYVRGRHGKPAKLLFTGKYPTAEVDAGLQPFQQYYTCWPMADGSGLYVLSTPRTGYGRIEEDVKACFGWEVER